MSVRDPLWQAMCLMCSMPPPVARRAPDGLASPSSKASTSAEEYVPGRVRWPRQAVRTAQGEERKAEGFNENLLREIASTSC